MTVVAVPIVEGHGEVTAVRTLLERLVATYRPGCTCVVLRPIRVPKSKIVKSDTELLRAVDLATLKLSETGAGGFILLLVDADNDAACVIGPHLTETVRKNRPSVDFVCVLPVKEYETWLIGGVEGLADLLIPGYERNIPEHPESSHVGKGWVERHFHGAKYSESVDQVRLTARFDLAAARDRCPSFDKLCREVEKRCD